MKRSIFIDTVDYRDYYIRHWVVKIIITESSLTFLYWSYLRFLSTITYNEMSTNQSITFLLYSLSQFCYPHSTFTKHYSVKFIRIIFNINKKKLEIRQSALWKNESRIGIHYFTSNIIIWKVNELSNLMEWYFSAQIYLTFIEWMIKLIEYLRDSHSLVMSTVHFNNRI